MKQTLVAAPAPHVPAPTLSQWPELSSLGALFWLAVRQHSRGRRLLILVFLFSLPALLGIVARSFKSSITGPTLELALVLHVLPHTLIPLTALLYASGMIQDEIEEQTLTYLLIRPSPRWAIYIAKLLATLLVTFVLAGVFTLITYVAIYGGSASLREGGIPLRALTMVGVFCLALGAYCSLFGWLSLLVRRSLIVGAAYIILFEGLLANIPFFARSLTIMYYFRVLTERWTGQIVKDWSINLNEAPSAWTCVGALTAVTVATTAFAALWFTVREFRVKTPEGS
jgi:ABC-2 type transport system permease protein